MPPYTSASAPRWSPKIFPIILSVSGTSVNKNNPPQTLKNTIKWRALNLSRLAISKATIEIIIPDMMKKSWRRFMVLLCRWWWARISGSCFGRTWLECLIFTEGYGWIFISWHGFRCSWHFTRKNCWWWSSWWYGTTAYQKECKGREWKKNFHKIKVYFWMWRV